MGLTIWYDALVPQLRELLAWILNQNKAVYK